MSKFSASEEIMKGMGPEKSEEERRLAMETDENTEALPSVPGDKNPADGAPLSKEAADGTVGEDGAPVYPDPKEKSDAEMAVKPDDVLNQEVAKEMGAAGTIEDAIKRVVVQAIKEASTPEGHVNKQAVDTMGAAKMSSEKLADGNTHPDDGKEVEIAKNVYATIEAFQEYGAPKASSYIAKWSIGGENVEPKSGHSAYAKDKRQAYEYALKDAKRAAQSQGIKMSTVKMADGRDRAAETKAHMAMGNALRLARQCYEQVSIAMQVLDDADIQDSDAIAGVEDQLRMQLRAIVNDYIG